MALPFDVKSGSNDPRALAILAKSIYRELRGAGYAANDVMSFASELLGLVATEVKDRRYASVPPPSGALSLAREGMRLPGADS